MKKIDLDIGIMIGIAICMAFFIILAALEGGNEREVFNIKCSHKDGKSISTPHGRVCLDKKVFIEID